ncbi:phosphoglycerate dehydrogenase [Candidatus Magnetominusculus xianensis]|uniref:2-hydroxyacid dehydrogenase n=1 Tax=Candidatus Magnetominusculus xianensis TaxID=1748249 RepID=A0ABR5SIS5_9BACT|nr:phosphoglycerate dehydrogenase [Candidatus Magnetominusculus xianensis]KWT92838.1 2-hydroxyacid dehydrogenase [Candidatus Magnetominusculus xianensis]MBF0403427.1 phosphoglycerate dehydrogenase [Nitrospirota bacterium]
MKKVKIAITTTSFGKYDEKPLLPLRAGFEIALNPYGRKLKKEETIEVCRGCVGVIAGTEPLSADVLDSLPDLRVISRCGTGLDNVDMTAAKRLGIEVFNTPDAPTRAVAELTLGMILNLLRKINVMDSSIRTGKWDKLMGNLLTGKNIGIIGFGRIGRASASLLQPFGCTIVFTDPFVEETPPFQKLSLNALLDFADIVIIHVSAKDMIMGAAEIARMKRGGWLINVSRGGTVDEEALFESLKSGHLRGAAIDVFEREPYDGKLRELKNTIVTPHIGSYAVESRVEMEILSTENLLKGLSPLSDA